MQKAVTWIDRTETGNLPPQVHKAVHYKLYYGYLPQPNDSRSGPTSKCVIFFSNCAAPIPHSALVASCTHFKYSSVYLVRMVSRYNAYITKDMTYFINKNCKTFSWVNLICPRIAFMGKIKRIDIKRSTLLFSSLSFTDDFNMEQNFKVISGYVTARHAKNKRINLCNNIRTKTCFYWIARGSW